MSPYDEPLTERGMDLDLRAALGDEGAPDLSDAILARLDAEADGEGAENGAEASGWTGHRLAAAASIALGVGAVIGIALMNDSDPSARHLQDPEARTQAAAPRHDVAGLPVRDGTLEMTLSNGIHLLIRAVPGSGWIGMQTVYDVGFLHEPAGLTQAAHLIEHLVCMGATASYQEGESFAKLDELGMVNAETMGDCTHYDFVLPAAHLELALQIEAERLTSLKFSAAQARHEAERADREADFAESNPKTGMLKHAFMALNQHWAHRATEAKVRDLLADLDLDALREFHRSGYRPDKLTVAIVGDVEIDAARALVERHLGAIEVAEAPPLQVPAWSDLDDRSEVRWNASPRGVVLTWAPPSQAGDRLEATAQAQLLQQRLATDKDLAALCNSIFCSSVVWPVRDLPLFVYATAADGVELETLARELEAEAREAMPRLMGPVSRQVGVQWVESNRTLTEATVEREARFNPFRPGVPNVALVLGQRALNWALAARGAASPEAIQARPRHALGPLAEQRPKVTLLRPSTPK